MSRYSFRTYGYVSVEGFIYNIQPYSVHDGPGMRMVIFLKGCPLRCRWCANPESQNPEPEIYYSRIRCIGCGLCVEACELGVLRLGEDGVVVERDRCVVCGMCRDACPTEAISIIGRQVSVEELVREVEKDRKYIMSAAGGVTFSGGEPLMQGDFLGAAAEALKAEGYHIAVETCGYAEYDKLAAVMDSVDLFLYDIKAFSRDLHRAGTVKDNRLILENAAKIPAEKDIIFRVPVIPGYNDGKNEIGEIASFIGELDSKRRVELMPFHNLGTAKYRGLGRGDEWPRTDPPKDEEMYALCDIFGSKGIQCEVV